MNIEANQIYRMDCLEGMKHIADKSVDMILCDLPYGITQNKWDVKIPLCALWQQYDRICKGAAVLFAQTPFDKILGSSNIKNLKYEWIWVKENATGFLNAKKRPLKKHENILVFYNKQAVYNPQFSKGTAYKAKHGKKSTNYGEVYPNYITVNDGVRFPVSILEFNRDKNKLHSTQKPVSLFEYLIKTYTSEGNTVLDNCMGSGTTAIACINTGRNYLGFEKEQKYFDIAQERIKKHLEQHETPQSRTN